ncbi:MAG: hypothetical protein IPL74_17255 [Bacteroidetes bacterium]|nr:hypothetical protein [Bacteroidota bacterium]
MSIMPVRVMFDWDYWNVAYSGRDNKIYKSENGGSAFGEMHAFGTNINEKVYWIEQSRANTDVIFAQQVVANISGFGKVPTVAPHGHWQLFHKISVI